MRHISMADDTIAGILKQSTGYEQRNESLGIKLVQNEENNGKIHNDLSFNNEEIQITGDYQSFCKHERWKETEQRIRTQNPPTKNAEYRKIAYRSFKELAKLLLSYKTYYTGNI